MMDQESLLLLQVKHGDKKAFELFTQRFWKPIFHLAYRFSGTSQDAEDLCQEIFLCVYRKADTYRGEGRAFTWLYRLATNTCLNWKRRQKPTCPLPEHEESDGGSAGEQALFRVQLQEAFYALTPQDRVLLLLRKFYGFSYDEMGEILAIPMARVKSRLHEAKARLAEKLNGARPQGGEAWSAVSSN